MLDNTFIFEEFEITNKRGLHARASAKFVQTVSGYESDVFVEKDGMKVGGDSIMGLMMLAASFGSTIKVSAGGGRAREVLDALRALITNKFGEDT
jgi:phosphocarrier protein HPr